MALQFAHPVEVVLGAYNVGSSTRQELFDDLDRLFFQSFFNRPSYDVLAMQETGDRINELTEYCRRHGLRIYLGDGSPGSDSVAIIWKPQTAFVDLRDTHPLVDAMKVAPGTGPEDAKRKVANRIQLRKRRKFPRGKKAQVLNVHFIASAHIRRKHYDLMAKRLLALIKRLIGIIVVLGDFNQDDDFEPLQPYHWIMRQWINEPTHGTRIIDLIWTRLRRRAIVTRSGVVRGLNSDHNSTFIVIKW